MSALPTEAEFVAAGMKVSGWSEEYAREVYRCLGRAAVARDEQTIADVLDGIAEREVAK